MTAGIHRKYNVTRTDGSDAPGGKHDGCAYFVLDLNCDEHALVALAAYAKSCKRDNPELAADIKEILANKPLRCSCREASCPHSLARGFGIDGESGMAHYLMDRADEAAGKRRDEIRVRGVDFDCEHCGKRLGSTLDDGWWRCKNCGYPGK